MKSLVTLDRVVAVEKPNCGGPRGDGQASRYRQPLRKAGDGEGRSWHVVKGRRFGGHREGRL